MHLIAEALLLLVGGAVIAYPGYRLARRLWPRSPRLEQAVLGGTLGLALAVAGTFFLSYLHLALAPVAWAIFAVIVCLNPGGNLRAASLRPYRPLAILLALVAVSRFVPLLTNPLPRQWDPSFHLLLAGRILGTRHMIVDWRPFMDIPLNYPVGSHVLLAVASWLSHVPLPRVFMVLLVGLGVLGVAQVYLLARRLRLGRDGALGAAFAYGFLAWYGGLNYLGWSGLPNQLAMSFVLGNFLLLARRRFGAREIVVFAILHVATVVTHHHVMLVAGCLYFGLIGWAAWRRDRGRCRGIFLGMALSVVLGAAYIVPYALKAVTLGQTKVLTYFEQPLTPLLVWRELGWVFAVLAVAGLVLGRRGRRLGSVRVAVGVLVGLFVLFDYVWFWWSGRHGRPATPFTPSRFLTDATIFLALPAGLALAWLRRRLRLNRVLTVLAMVALAATMTPHWRDLNRHDLKPAVLRAYAWIRANTPAETIVLTGDQWAAYCTWRRATYVPRPISEPEPPPYGYGYLVEQMVARHLPWMDDLYLVILASPESLAAPHKVLWRDPAGSGLAVCRLLGPPPSR